MNKILAMTHSQTQLDDILTAVNTSTPVTADRLQDIQAYLDAKAAADGNVTFPVRHSMRVQTWTFHHRINLCVWRLFMVRSGCISS